MVKHTVPSTADKILRVHLLAVLLVHLLDLRLQPLALKYDEKLIITNAILADNFADVGKHNLSSSAKQRCWFETHCWSGVKSWCCSSFGIQRLNRTHNSYCQRCSHPPRCLGRLVSS
jgi:hypothetical protein